MHIDADIKVPKITGDIRTYSAQYRFFDLFELEDLFFSGDDPMFNPGAEKRRRTIRRSVCFRADFISAYPKF